MDYIFKLVRTNNDSEDVVKPKRKKSIAEFQVGNALDKYKKEKPIKYEAIKKEFARALKYSELIKYCASVRIRQVASIYQAERVQKSYFFLKRNIYRKQIKEDLQEYLQYCKESNLQKMARCESADEFLQYLKGFNGVLKPIKISKDPKGLLPKLDLWEKSLQVRINKLKQNRSKYYLYLVKKFFILSYQYSLLGFGDSLLGYLFANIFSKIFNINNTTKKLSQILSKGLGFCVGMTVVFYLCIFNKEAFVKMLELLVLNVIGQFNLDELEEKFDDANAKYEVSLVSICAKRFVFEMPKLMQANLRSIIYKDFSISIRSSLSFINTALIYRMADNVLFSVFNKSLDNAPLLMMLFNIGFNLLFGVLFDNIKDFFEIVMSINQARKKYNIPISESCYKVGGYSYDNSPISSQQVFRFFKNPKEGIPVSFNCTAINNEGNTFSFERKCNLVKDDTKELGLVCDKDLISTKIYNIK